MKNGRTQGFTLIEVIIAGAILVTLSAVVASSLSAMSESAERQQTLYVASQAMSVLRHQHPNGSLAGSNQTISGDVTALMPELTGRDAAIAERLTYTVNRTTYRIVDRNLDWPENTVALERVGLWGSDEIHMDLNRYDRERM